MTDLADTLEALVAADTALRNNSDQSLEATLVALGERWELTPAEALLQAWKSGLMRVYPDWRKVLGYLQDTNRKDEG